jgi:hypothetical protein
VALGTLILPADKDRFYTVMGGPYRQRPRGTIGVKLAREVEAFAHVSIPTVDFKTPPTRLLMFGLDQMLNHLIRGKQVYVGCMGGMGRTGLFMAALCKLWGIPHAIKYVRKNYYHRAVETQAQEKYIRNLHFPYALKRKVEFAQEAGRFLNDADCLTEVIPEDAPLAQDSPIVGLKAI